MYEEKKREGTKDGCGTESEVLTPGCYLLDSWAFLRVLRKEEVVWLNMSMVFSRALFSPSTLLICLSRSLPFCLSSSFC